MPVRSTGCLTCRKRKIRCDETRPACRKCATHGVTCPGYRTQEKGGLEFRDQTHFTVQRANEQYRVKATSPSATSQSRRASSGNTPDSCVGDWGSLDFSDTLVPYLPSPQSICSPGANRDGIYNTFLDVYVPKDPGRPGPQSEHFTFYELMATMPDRSPALTESMDALSLVAVGSIHKDQQLLKQSVSVYGRALRELRRAIAQKDFMHDDQVLASIAVLTQCELFDEISQLNKGWQNHTQGALQLITARGPERLQSDLALLIFMSMRHAAFNLGLISRKASPFAKTSWRDVSDRTPTQDSSTRFYNIAFEVPGLLERYDELDDEPEPIISDIDRLLADCGSLETRLRSWYSHFHAQLLQSRGMTYQSLPISSFAPFCESVTEPTLPSAFRFSNFMIAYLHSLYWMSMFYLRRATQGLHMIRNQLDNDWLPDNEHIVHEDEIVMYILNMMQCFPFFCEPISSDAGHIGIFLPMRTAAFYFREKSQWQYMKWIGQVRDNVFNKGLSPPNVGDPKGYKSQQSRTRTVRHGASPALAKHYGSDSSTLGHSPASMPSLG